MARYLMSFDDGAMTLPEEEAPAVGEATHQMVREAQEATARVFGGVVASRPAHLADACPCGQEVREIMFDPLV